GLVHAATAIHRLQPFAGVGMKEGERALGGRGPRAEGRQRTGGKQQARSRYAAETEKTAAVEAQGLTRLPIVHERSPAVEAPPPGADPTATRHVVVVLVRADLH